MSPHDPNASDPSPDRLLFVVTGSEVAAERFQRPAAYRLREHVIRWIETSAAESADGANGAADPFRSLEPVVCSDLWYMNQTSLRARPTISIGHPNANAASAFFANRLPPALVIDDPSSMDGEAFRVLLDVELTVLWAAIWGRDVSATGSAVDLFAERYLDRFLRRALGL